MHTSCAFAVRLFLLIAAATSAWAADGVRGTPIAPAPTVTATNKGQWIGATVATNDPAKFLGKTNAPYALPEKIGEYAGVGFDKLAGFRYEPNDDLLAPKADQLDAATAQTDAMIPDGIRKLNGQRVAIRGFMLPLRVEGGTVTELLILRDQSMCCYGTTPKFNEWVSVKMKKTAGGVKPVMDQPVLLFGTLNIGSERDHGYLMSIYRLDGEKMAEE